MSEEEEDDVTGISVIDNPWKSMFQEQHEDPITIIYKLSKYDSDKKLEEAGQNIIDGLKDVNIQYEDVGIDTNDRGSYVAIRMRSTNLGSTEVKDIIQLGMEVDGYEDTIFSTVLPDKIVRFN